MKGDVMSNDWVSDYITPMDAVILLEPGELLPMNEPLPKRSPEVRAAAARSRIVRGSIRERAAALGFDTDAAGFWG